MREEVYLLWFEQEREDAADIELLIGAYDTEEAAKAAVERVKDKPGFIKFPEGFSIHTYQIGRDSWTEGFIETH